MYVTSAVSRSAQMFVPMGIAWNSGSPTSNRTGTWAAVNFQFIVNDMLIQSLSMIAVSGWIACLNALAGPMISSREPAGLVRNRNGVFHVMIPLPNWLLIHGDHVVGVGVEQNVDRARAPDCPCQVAVKPTGLRTHQPVWLAMVSGRQR